MTAPTTGTTDTSRLETRMRAVLQERSLLKHPFYRDWTEGTLTLDRLREYGRQYYHFEAAFPRLLSTIHSRIEEPGPRQIVLDNLWDEEHGDRNHRALWLEFAGALGLSEDEVTDSTPRPETQALLDFFWTAARERPAAEALAALFGYEGQVPEVATEKIRGLREHEARYGVGADGMEFFRVHVTADVAHSASEVAAIAALTSDEDAVVSTVEQACDVLNRFLDGCYEA